VFDLGHGWGKFRCQKGGYRHCSGAPMETDPAKLRELAAWYRKYAIKAENPTIWEARLKTAEDMEAEADRLESMQEGHARACVALEGS
jgi:hypothetical protein